MSIDDVLDYLNSAKFYKNGFVTMIVVFKFNLPDAYGALLIAGLDVRLSQFNTQNTMLSYIRGLK